MYIVPFTSESGDHYLFGPFGHAPTHDEVMAVFRAHTPDEADYVQEMLDHGDLSTPFKAYLLPMEPGTIDMQMAAGFGCR